MARYRFQWYNVAPELLAVLGEQFDASEPTAEAIRRAYGARPKLEFVAEQWPVLLESWLPHAPDSLESIVDELQARNVGQPDMRTSTPAERLEYLRTCRNTSGLRQVVLDEFIRAGESDLTPMPLMKPAPDDAPPVRVDVESEEPSGPASLTEFIEETLKSILEVSELARDDDGDIPIRQGSAMCYVRVEEREDQPSRVVLFSQLVAGVEKSMDLLESLNEINLQLPLGRVLHVNNLIMLTVELLADTLSPQEFAWTLEFITSTSDYYDTRLATRFGGQARFDDAEVDNVEV